MHEVWALGFNRITREVHLIVQVDVGDGVVGQFSSEYLTENECRITILGKISMNGSVEYFGIPDFHRTDGPTWDDNFLDPCSSWGDGGTNLNWGVQTGGPYRNVAMAWVLPSLPILLTKPGFRRAQTLLRSTSVMTSVVRGVTSLIVDAL